MRILKKVLILVVPVIAWGILFGLGCQGKEEKEKAKKEPVAAIGPSPEVCPSSGKKQMLPDMGKRFPKEMLEALQKKGPERGVSPPAKKDPVPVSMPPDVQSRWKAVVIAVTNKQTKEQKDYVVNINESFTIPETRMRVDVLSFLPDFSMSPEGITSLSSEPGNPAARVAIHEDGKRIFEGWLFQKLPMVHPFEHKTYAIKLDGVVKSSNQTAKKKAPNSRRANSEE